MAHIIPGKIAYDFDRGSVAVLCSVGGREVRALVSEEALQDKSKHLTVDPSELVEIARMFGPDIAAAVETKVVNGALENGLAIIRSGEF